MRRLAVLAVSLAAVLLPGCDAGEGSTTKTPPAAARSASKTEWTVTHILVASSDSPSPQHQGKVTRSRAAAKQVAMSLIAEAAAGRSFDELVRKYTGDTDPSGTPNTNNGKPGSYTFGAGMMVPAFEKAAKELPVGKITPEPVETPYGWHIIRRDA